MQADPGNVRELLEAIVTAFSVLGGGMAYWSGFKAAQALARREPPGALAHTIDRAIGEGFVIFSRFSPVALAIMLWT